MELSDLIHQSRSYNGIPFEHLSLRYASLGHLLATRAIETGDRPWICFYDAHTSPERLTYAEFYRRVVSVAAYLRRSGIQPGERVATVAHNHVDTVIQYFAAWFVGASVVPVNVSEDDDRIVYILRHARVVLAFVRDDYAERFGVLASSVGTLRRTVFCGTGVEPGGWERFSDIVSGPVDANEVPHDGGPGHECLIVYTSGTTGNPKGVVLTHGNMLVDASAIAEWHGITSDTSMMCVLPIHHVNGTVVTLVTPMVAGTSVVLNRKFQSGTFFERLAAERVGIVSVVPTLLAFLVQSDIDISRLDLQRLRHFICGAGPLTCELAERFQIRYRQRVVHGYGLSETTCYSCFLPVDLSDASHAHWMTSYGFPSIGVAISCNEMDIQDPEGNAKPAGERGEIVIRGHNVMPGYYDNPQANRDAFTNGWFRSGDEGFYQVDERDRRFYFITGRIKELIIRGGVNVSPLEIDEVLNAHPSIDAAIAVGFENTWYGEEIGAYVRTNDPSLTSSDVIAWCHDRLPFFKAPKVVVFGHDIPVTSTGKYQRNRVRHLFAEYRDVQFHG